MKKKSIMLLIVNLVYSMMFCCFSYADSTCQNVRNQEDCDNIYFSEIGDDIIVNKDDNSIRIDFFNSNFENKENYLMNKYGDVNRNSCFSFSIEFLRQYGIFDNESEFFFPKNDMTVFEFELWLSKINQDQKIQENEKNFNHTEQNVAQKNELLTCDKAILMLYNNAILSNNSIASGKHDITGRITKFINNNSISIEEKAKEVFLSSGIISYEEPNAFKTGKILKREEAANYLSRYILYDKKPDLIIGDDVCKYLEEEFVNDNDDYLEPENSPKWTNSAHITLTTWGFQVLFNDKSSSISNLAGKYSSTARGYVIDGVDDPDVIENDNGTYVGHYCNPNLLNKYLNTIIH